MTIGVDDAPVIFRPRYTWRIPTVQGVRFLVFGIPALIAMIGGDAVLRAIAGVIVGGLFLFGVLLYVRWIEFRPDTIAIIRFLRPPKVLPYSDIVELGENAITIRHWGKLYIQSMTNSGELLVLFRRFVPTPAGQTEADRKAFRESYNAHIAGFVVLIFALLLIALLVSALFSARP
jgi:hypothetical protein